MGVTIDEAFFILGWKLKMLQEKESPNVDQRESQLPSLKKRIKRQFVVKDECIFLCSSTYLKTRGRFYISFSWLLMKVCVRTYIRS